MIGPVAPPFPGIPRACRFCGHPDILYAIVPKVIPGHAEREAPYGVCAEHGEQLHGMRETLGLTSYWWREIPLYMGYSHLLKPWSKAGDVTLCCGKLISELTGDDSFTITPALAMCNGEG